MATEKPVFPNNPFSSGGEPNDSSTVEEALQYCLMQSHKETEAKYLQISASLKEQFSKGKGEIWKCHQRVVDESEKANKHNTICPSNSAKNSRILTQAGFVFTTVNVNIIGGQYAGNTYNLVPKARQPCWVGRSQGKRFKDRGISLAKDLEISTAHGKFELVGGKLYYTDTGSTNGSKIGGEDLRPDTPFPLEEGLELVLGQTILKVSLS